jgi:hypothetical protein
MQASPSSLTTNQDLESFVVVEGGSYSTSVGGRKSDDLVAEVKEVSSDELSSADDVQSMEGYVSEEEEDSSDDDEEEEGYYESDEEDEEDDEIEEFFEERALIRKEALELKKLAGFFYHPERQVVAEAMATASCFFDRTNVMDDIDYDGAEAVERARIMTCQGFEGVGYHLPASRTCIGGRRHRLWSQLLPSQCRFGRTCCVS